MSEIAGRFIKELDLKTSGFQRCYDYSNYEYIYFKKQKDALIYIDIDVENDKFVSIKSFISFSAIEQLIRELCLKHKLEYLYPITINPYYIIEHKESITLLFSKYSNNKLTSSNLLQAASSIKKYLTLSYQPFWEKYSSLQVVNDEIIDKVDQMKSSDYIPGSYMDLKKMIIMKLCKNINYNSYISWLDSTWVEDSKTMDISKDSNYLVYCDLKEILKTK